MNAVQLALWAIAGLLVHRPMNDYLYFGVTLFGTLSVFSSVCLYVRVFVSMCCRRSWFDGEPSIVLHCPQWKPAAIVHRRLATTDDLTSVLYALKSSLSNRSLLFSHRIILQSNRSCHFLLTLIEFAYSLTHCAFFHAGCQLCQLSLPSSGVGKSCTSLHGGMQCTSSMCLSICLSFWLMIICTLFQPCFSV